MKSDRGLLLANMVMKCAPLVQSLVPGPPILLPCRVLFKKLLPDNMAALGRLQQLPAALDVMRPEPGYYALGNLLEVAGGQRQDGRPRARETHPEQPGLCAWRHVLDNIRQPGNQGLAVGLVQLVLHRQVDQIRVRRRLAECYGQECYSLQVERLVSGSASMTDKSCVKISVSNSPHQGEDTLQAAQP